MSVEAESSGLSASYLLSTSLLTLISGIWGVVVDAGVVWCGVVLKKGQKGVSSDSLEDSRVKKR